MVYFIGAGPGAKDLITVRGAQLLSTADVVVYAGSLVNPELLDYCKPTCATYDSAGMTLEEVICVLRKADEQSQQCVRLHTGDPALYGAIAEQMEALDELQISYEVVPGISSLFGATAALATELTKPGVSQSLIVTRVEGRTPMPNHERLRDLAAHGCTMALFLSAGLLNKAQEELLAGGYAPTTPVALVSRATWPDQAVYRCALSQLAACAAEHGVQKTALVIVGDVLEAGMGHGEEHGEGCGTAPRAERSKLYDPAFSHGYRRASHGGGTQ